MADERTQSVRERRLRLKVAGFALVGVLLGLLLKLTFNFEPVTAFEKGAEFVTKWEPQIEQWLKDRPTLRGWVAGPVALGLLFFGLTAFKWVRAALDRLFPDPPSFVASDLDAAKRRRRLVSLEGPPLIFVGRDKELAELNNLITGPQGAFAWRALIGPGGMGKTRLAIEWLERARAQGWDVGIVDKNDLNDKLKGWRARRRTALVVDEARREWDDSLGEALVALANAGTAKRPVRALVLEQMQPFVNIAEGEERDRVNAAEVRPPLRLPGLEDSHIDALRTASGQTRLPAAAVIRESGGRPRAALILLNSTDATTHVGAVIEWIDGYVDDIANHAKVLPLEWAGPLFLCALGGPILTDIARDLFGSVNVEPLVRFFEGETRQRLEQTLPPLVPDDLAQELILRLFPRLDRRVGEAAFDRMVLEVPAHVQARLAGLWSDRAGP